MEVERKLFLGQIRASILENPVVRAGEGSLGVVNSAGTLVSTLVSQKMGRGAKEMPKGSVFGIRNLGALL